MPSPYATFSRYPAAANQESYGTALLLGLGAAALGVVGWIYLAEAFQLRSALVAFAVALATTAAFARYAPDDRRAPVTIVVLTVASALVGLLGSQYALLAHDVHLSFFTTVRDVPLHKVPRLVTTGTDAFTWVIVALSGFTGYRQAMRLRAMRTRFQSAARAASVSAPVVSGPPVVPPAT
jgi:hypothetical protein